MSAGEFARFNLLSVSHDKVIISWSLLFWLLWIFCHMIRSWLHFIIQVPKCQGRALPGEFRWLKVCRIWGAFGQLHTSIANISRTDQDVKNRKDLLTECDSSRVGGKKSGVLWSTNNRVGDVHFDPPKSTFLEGLISAPRGCLTLPYLTFVVGRLLHLPSAEAVSVWPKAQPRCNQKVTVICCEAETSAVKPNKSPATWDWWRVVWLFLSGGLR